MAELLVELFSEEIPARMQARAAEDLKRLVSDALKAANLSFDSAQAFTTPRRLALVVAGLPAQQPDAVEEKKGPKQGAPAQAVDGFMKANGLASLDAAELRETDKGPFYFVVRKIAGRPTAEVLPDLLARAIAELPWPKSMRWAGDSQRWVRPLHGIVAVFDGIALKGGLAMGEGRQVPFGAQSRGHRFLAPAAFDIIAFDDYRVKLHGAKVMLDPAERRALIAQQAAALAREAGVRVKDDAGLLDEVTGLVEWPQVLMGRVDAAFMDLPAEVLSTSMRSHQKYFSTETPDGRLAERFLVVANMEAPAGSERAKTIVAGNERVLRARLADARFFWDQDRKQPLSARVPALKEIVFHARLGTLADKVSRMEALAVAIAKLIEVDHEAARSAAHLAKADLTTGMVGEFPELQGIMGCYYALNDGETPAVADAVAQHYQPLGPNDACPSAPVSVCVALADKIDTLVGFWMIDEKPTGSKDPYALRRAALGVIRLIVENDLSIPMEKVLLLSIDRILTERSYQLVGDALNRIEALVEFGVPAKYVEELEVKYTGSAELVSACSENVNLLDGMLRFPSMRKHGLRVAAELLDFFAERLKVALRHKGVRHDLVSAVFAASKQSLIDDFDALDEVDFVRVLARVDALSSFLESSDGASLLTAYRRAANIVRIEEKKAKTLFDGGASPELMIQAEEKELYSALNVVAAEANGLVKQSKFSDAMTVLTSLRKPVDAFFDNVTVNAEDPALRQNRLSLLKQIDHTFAEVADFSKIEG